MNTIYANDVGLIKLGYQSENNRTEVIFDVSDLATEFPDGMVSVVVRRPTDSAGHLVTSITQNGSIVTWLVNDYELEFKGLGELQLIYTVPGVVAKTKIWSISTDRSLTFTDSIPPDWRDIANSLLDAASELHGVTEQIKTWRDETVSAKEATVSAKEATESYRDETKILHDSTSEKAEQASSDARTAAAARTGMVELYDSTKIYADQAESAASQVALDKNQIEIWHRETKQYRDEAEHFADLAEQCAAIAGYMDMEIVDGHLIYRRTENVDVSFLLQNGRLIRGGDANG